jgi:hypothetical protein
MLKKIPVPQLRLGMHLHALEGPWLEHPFWKTRFVITDQDHVIMASEMGVLTVPEERVVRKWRLQPGKMLLIDMEEGRIIEDEEIKASLADAEPYAEWLARTQFKLEDLPEAPPAEELQGADPQHLLDRQQADRGQILADRLGGHRPGERLPEARPTRARIKLVL